MPFRPTRRAKRKMKTNRRSFLKFLSVSPAIFHASSGFGKFSEDTTKELLSTPELLQAATEPTPVLPTPYEADAESGSFYPTGSVIIRYPGKPSHTGGTATYNPETNMTTHIFTQSGTFK